MVVAPWDLSDVIPILDQCPDLVSVSYWSGQILYMNPAGIEYVGFSDLAEAVASTTGVFVSEDPQNGSPVIEHELRTHGVWRGDATLKHVVTGERLPVSTTVFVLEMAGDEPYRVAAISRDARFDEARDESLRDAMLTASSRADEYRALAEISHLAIQGDLSTVLQAATDAALSLVSVDSAAIFRPTTNPNELLAVSYTGDFEYPPTAPAGNRSMTGYSFAQNKVILCTDVATETRFSVETLKKYGLEVGAAIPIEAPDGPWGVLAVHAGGVRIFTAEDIAFLIAVAGIVSTTAQRIDLENALRRRSKRDPLTGLPNRLEAFARMDAELAKPQATAVMLIDLDDFKKVNDVHGHAIGDDALRSLAERLSAVTRPTDLVARLGGDEFVVICGDIGSTADAVERAQQLVDSVKVPTSAHGSLLSFSASIGVAIGGAAVGVDSSQELVRRADLAMYRSKGVGPGRYAVYEPSDDARLHRRAQLNDDLRRALDDAIDDECGLTVQYTAQFDLRSGLVQSAVARPMWQHPLLGVIDDHELGAAAVATDLMTVLNKWIFRTAAAAAKSWRTHWDVRVDLHLNGIHFGNPGLTTRVFDLCAASGVPPHAVGLRAPRREWAVASPATHDNMMELRAAGVRVTINADSLGRGFVRDIESYAAVGAFTFDAQIVGRLPGETSEAICRALISLAHAVGAEMLAEGISTVDQYYSLKACGCDYGSGDFFAEPGTAADLETLLQKSGRPNTTLVLTNSDSADMTASTQAWLDTLEIHSVYQPVVDLVTREVVGYEALARGPVDTVLHNPATLFDFAHRLGVVSEVDWLCRLAALRGAEEAGLPESLALFVNCEPIALSAPAPPEASALLDAASRRVTVMEVTERGLTVDPAGLLAAADVVRSYGGMIALDDVGADRESLALLPFLHASIIKLDLSIIRNNLDNDTAEVITAVSAESQRTGAVILAEGIETEEQAALALSMGATLGQGWLFGRGESLPTFESQFPARKSTVVLPNISPIKYPLGSATTPFKMFPPNSFRTSSKSLVDAMRGQLERQLLGVGSCAVVLATFEQSYLFDESAASRFATIAANSSFVAVFGVDMPPTPARGVRGVAITAADPLAEEWTLVVVGPHFSGAIIALDHGVTADEDSRFSYQITYDRSAVVAAAELLLRKIPAPPEPVQLVNGG